MSYARVSTGALDVEGQTIRLEHAGAIRVFTDIKSGKNMDRAGLADLAGNPRIVKSMWQAHSAALCVRSAMANACRFFALPWS